MDLSLQLFQAHGVLVTSGRSAASHLSPPSLALGTAFYSAQSHWSARLLFAVGRSLGRKATAWASRERFPCVSVSCSQNFRPSAWVFDPSRLDVLGSVMRGLISVIGSRMSRFPSAYNARLCQESHNHRHICPFLCPLCCTVGQHLYFCGRTITVCSVCGCVEPNIGPKVTELHPQPF